MMPEDLKILGWVRSEYSHSEQCPRQAAENGKPAEIVFDQAYLPALEGLQKGREYLVLTWLHQARRDKLRCRPRGDERNPEQGVCSTRSPHRPNPIGLHQVRLLEIDQYRLLVHPLEVLDQTPVLDLKPVLEQAPVLPWGQQVPGDKALKIKEAAGRAWQRGLLSGFNGNLSLKQGTQMIITCSGTAKAFIQPGDLVCMDLETGEKLGRGRVSTEARMHLQIYRAQPAAGAVVHSHPPGLLTLDMQGRRFMDLELFEAAQYRELLCTVPQAAPGSERLATLVGSAARDFQAVFMSRHGLTCWAGNLDEALALSEELETLAKIQLKNR